MKQMYLADKIFWTKYIGRIRANELVLILEYSKTCHEQPPKNRQNKDPDDKW